MYKQAVVGLKEVIMDEKDKRGGKRPGAGRPKGTTTVSMHLKLRKSLVDYVNSKSNKNGFINDCIEEKMKSESFDRDKNSPQSS